MRPSTAGDARPRVRLRSPLLPILLLLVALLTQLAPWSGWWVLLGGLGGMLLLAWGWARALAAGLSLRRERRFGWSQVGDRLEERWTLVNRGSVPALWVEVLDHSTLPGYEVSQVRAVGAGGSTRWRSEGRCTQRGLFQLGPTTLRAGDPFALFDVTLPLPASLSLLVTPPVRALPPIAVAAGGQGGEGRARPWALERVRPTASVRPYHPGDPLHWVHWRSSARLRQLHVRLWDAAPVGDWWLMLDMAAAVQHGVGAAATDEHAIILAASLAAQGAGAGRAVGVVAQGRAPLWLAPRRDAAQQMRILRALALLERGETPLATLLARAAPSLRRHSSLVIITPDCSGGWVEPLLSLQRRGIVPTVLLLDPDTFGGNGGAAPLRALLASLGVNVHAIPRALLEVEEAPGQQGDWGWRVLGTGRVIATRRPPDLRWQEL